MYDPSLTSDRMPSNPTDPRWTAITRRDPSADGQFFYSVSTTGVFCRPSCSARQPRRENVAFHASAEAARRAGFRPCRRCRPEEPSLAARRAEMVAAACRAIEAAEEPPSLTDLARGAGLSPHHFHRLFKAQTGLTPKDYAAAHRARRVQANLATSQTVTEAIFDAGFNANSRFYETSAHILGMTPTRYRNGGADAEIRFAVARTSLGDLLVAESDKGVCAILLGDDPETLVRDLQDRFSKARLVGADRAFEARVAEVVGLVEAPGTGGDLPLDVRGTAFQQRVWKALRDIPPGATATYAQIASRIGAPRAARAVAQACAANPLAVAIPCHRVVRQDGELGGYRWGVARKRDLLEREGVAA